MESFEGIDAKRAEGVAFQLFRSEDKIHVLSKGTCRDYICHKHHKQRLCKIITTRVKLYFVDVF